MINGDRVDLVYETGLVINYFRKKLRITVHKDELEVLFFRDLS